MVKNETKLRSSTKSILWRILGVLILATITYAYTREWIQTGLITIIHHGAFLFVFYFHERLWLRVKWPKKFIWHSIAKCFTYETILGNLILGVITYLITNNIKQMTQVTITYISIKHVAYIWNEFIWDRIKRGRE